MKFKIISNEHTPNIIENINPNIFEDKKDLLVKFLSFSRRQHHCAGLASNQCSVGTKKIQNRIKVPFFAMKNGLSWDLFIHPRIIEYKGEEKEVLEKCLTWIGKVLITKRYPEIDTEYYNIKGELIKKTFKGYEAQIFQHEYDHLLGIEEKFYYENENNGLQ